MTRSGRHHGQGRRRRALLSLALGALGLLAATGTRAAPPGPPPPAPRPLQIEAAAAPTAAAPAPAAASPQASPAPTAAAPAAGPGAAEAPPGSTVEPPTPAAAATADQAAPPPPGAAPSAEETPRATASLKVLTETGVRLYEQGDFAGAIQAFTRGYALRPKPLFLFNIAQAYRKSGQHQSALEYYEKFIRIDPRSPYRAEADAYIAYLRGKLRPDAAPAAAPPSKRVYKKGWFWGVLGSSAAVTGIAVTLGIVLGTRDPVTTLGTIEPRFR